MLACLTEQLNALAETIVNAKICDFIRPADGVAFAGSLAQTLTQPTGIESRPYESDGSEYRLA